MVREGYAKIAKQESSCCGSASSCGSSDIQETISKEMGYTDEELNSVPEGANLGLGCGNPVAIATLKEGETVLDLGSGAGFDCFLAARKVGGEGRVIGVDMTPEMVEKARENARKGNCKNVEFRLGEIENLPAADNSVDVVISNCVINLSTHKEKVFREAFRVLKPGGRLVVSDIVLVRELPDSVKNSIEAYIGCLSGAIMLDKYIGSIVGAQFQEIRVVDETTFPVELMVNDPTAEALISELGISSEQVQEITNSVVSIKVCAVKPNKGA